MIVPFRVYVFGPVGVMLKRWHSANEVATCREDKQHRNFTITPDASAHLVPAAYGTCLCHAPVVSSSHAFQSNFPHGLGQ